MGRPRRLALALASLLLLSCAGAREKGDEAFARSDWDAAVVSYEKALRDADDPGEIARVQALLDEARARSGEAHLRRSRERSAAGDLAGAWEEAERAWRFAPSDASAARVGELRGPYAASLLASGRAAAESGDRDRAVSLLERSQSLVPTDEGGRLLAAAREEAARFHRDEYLGAVARAELAFAVRDWANAAALYERAHRHGSTPESLRRADFCRALDEAERAAARGDDDRARARFEDAAGTGVDPEYVHARMAEVLPGRYVLVIHQAVVLPFRPGDLRPWDGDGAAPVPGAADLLDRLAAPDPGPSGMPVKKAARLVEEAAAGLDAPDCYVLVDVGGRTAGSRDGADENECRPVWNLRVPLAGRTTDTRVVTVEVRDRDPRDDENVGTWTVPLGELLATPGLREIYFINRKGRPTHGGLVALVISVEAP